MNDPIKYMLVGAAIAVSSATISGVVVGWSVSQAPSARPRSVQSASFPTGPAARLKLPAQTAASILPPGQFTLPPPRQPGSSNLIIRPTTKSFPPPAAFQKAQELPEVKAAREAFMEAQKKYSEAMKKAMGAGTEVRIQKTEVSGLSKGGAVRTWVTLMVQNIGNTCWVKGYTLEGWFAQLQGRPIGRP